MRGGVSQDPGVRLQVQIPDLSPGLLCDLQHSFSVPHLPTYNGTTAHIAAVRMKSNAHELLDGVWSTRDAAPGKPQVWGHSRPPGGSQSAQEAPPTRALHSSWGRSDHVGVGKAGCLEIWGLSSEGRCAPDARGWGLSWTPSGQTEGPAPVLPQSSHSWAWRPPPAPPQGFVLAVERGGV